jgi:hypothetical protein
VVSQQATSQACRYASLSQQRFGRLHWLAGRLLADVNFILVASLADEAADHTGLGFVQL